MKSMCHPGGDTFALGGASMVQVAPLQENAGKIVREPMAFPWVLEVAREYQWRLVRPSSSLRHCLPAMRETFMFAVLP